MKKGVDIGFAPAFVASLVTYLITVNPHVEGSGYLQFGLQMLALATLSVVWAAMAMFVVATGVFALQRLNGD